MKKVTVYIDRFGGIHKTKKECLKTNSQRSQWGSRYCPSCCGYGPGNGVAVCQHCKYFPNVND